MTIEVKQTCDGCAKERIITRPENAEHAGWRKVQPNTHLCTECIAKALGKTND